ncbi:hypothetical protein MUK42_02815 [Musa troglodytarum]|uniref:Uncharacterized protein n=1 Tax=Musa troglodytarum TaxID=320322 RepID=A0A9E7KM80_9LILI|nr:hypothetical protein MUK42_02815 [Musa troglodytarum]
MDYVKPDVPGSQFAEELKVSSCSCGCLQQPSLSASAAVIQIATCSRIVPKSTFPNCVVKKRGEEMKLVWCPENAAKAYIDAVKAVADRDLEETNVAELVAAMAGGWRAQLIVEAWSRDAGAATGVGLRAAARHARGRHVCVVPDEQSAAEYVEAVRRAGGAAEAGSVVVGRRRRPCGSWRVDLVVGRGRVLRRCGRGRGDGGGAQGAGRRRGGAAAVFGSGTRVVRSTYLPIGSGVEVLHVGVGKGPSLGGDRPRWVRHFDHCTKEEHVFRRR